MGNSTMELAVDGISSTIPTRYDKLVVRRLARCILELRALRSEFQAQTIHLLLEVAIQPGITIGELGERTGLSQASCSRNVFLLSNRDRHGKPGLGLVRSEEDPVEPRRNIVRLTKEGQELIAQLADIVR